MIWYNSNLKKTDIDMFPSPIWVYVNLLCRRWLSQSLHFCYYVHYNQVKATWWPRVQVWKNLIHVLPIHYDPHVSQKHICSLLLNKCQDCTRMKRMKDTPHPGALFKEQQLKGLQERWSVNVIINHAPGPKYWHLPPECMLLFKGLFHSHITAPWTI